MEPAAEQIRAALVRAAVQAYEDARVRGLCEAGAFEAAVGAMRTLELGPPPGGSAGERP